MYRTFCRILMSTQIVKSGERESEPQYEFQSNRNSPRGGWIPAYYHSRQGQWGRARAG